MCSDFFAYLGLSVHSNKVPAVFGKPGEPAILLGINHEAIVEPLIIASLLNRPDVRFVGMKVFQYLGKNISDLIYPVLPKKVAIDYQGGCMQTLKSRLDIVLEMYRMESLTIAQIERLNDTSLKSAAVHVEYGGLLIIFPNGGRSIDRSWYPGVGKLIKRLQQPLTTTIPIYPIRTSGICRNQLGQCVRNAAAGNPKQTLAKAMILDPIHLPPGISIESPQEITDYLRSKTVTRIRTVPASDPASAVSELISASGAVLD